MRIGGILLSVIVLGVQVINSIFLVLSNDKILLSYEDRMREYDEQYTPMSMTTENLTTLSDSRNVVVFIVDRFDEEYAELAYAEAPDVYDELTGFTWFRDNIAMFGQTFPSIAWLLTNSAYSSAMGRIEYLNSAYEGDTPLQKLHDAGYEINLYSQRFYAISDEYYFPDYIANLNEAERVPFTTGERLLTAEKLSLLSMYRCFPFLGKKLFGDMNSDLTSRLRGQMKAEGNYSVDTKFVYDTVADADFTVEAQKSFHFIHVTGCHDVKYNLDFGPASEQDKADMGVPVRYSFKMIDRYLREMKRLGVYDGATIVITGDHAAPHDVEREVCEPRLTALFVKPSGVGEGALKTSMAQVSHADLWATIFDSEGLPYDESYGTPVYDVPEDAVRTRINRWHTRGRTDLDEYVYEITGAGNDFSNWKEVGHEHYKKNLLDY